MNTHTHTKTHTCDTCVHLRVCVCTQTSQNHLLCVGPTTLRGPDSAPPLSLKRMELPDRQDCPWKRTWHQPRLSVTSDCSGERRNSTIFCQFPGAETGLILPSAVPPAPGTLSGVLQLPQGHPAVSRTAADAGAGHHHGRAQHTPETLPETQVCGMNNFITLFSGSKLRTSPCAGLLVSRTGTVRGAGGSTCYRPGWPGTHSCVWQQKRGESPPSSELTRVSPQGCKQGAQLGLVGGLQHSLGSRDPMPGAEQSGCPQGVSHRVSVLRGEIPS